MKTEFTVGQKVVAPINGEDGTIFETGKLVSINSRFAKVELSDGRVISVGCTKIEPFVVKAAPKAKNKPIVNRDVCPACESRDVIHYHDSENAEQAKSFDRENACLACGHEWGRQIRRSEGRIADNYEYTKVKAASGRSSVDNNDEVAQALREKTLEQVYTEVSATVGIEVKALKALYVHLNPGQQRMCLGNRLRGWLKKNA